MTPFTVCIGYDSREPVAWHVCAHSIMRRARRPVQIVPLVLDQLYHLIGDDAKGSTEFSLSRFLTPYLSNCTVSMFVDCDFLFLEDVWKLYELAHSCADMDVLCVQHEYAPKRQSKFLGHKQYVYQRKNWSSLMLFNGHRSAIRALTPEKISQMSPTELHQMVWARTIGNIQTEWNYLVGEYPYRPPGELYALHYTLGGPWFNIQSEYSEIWREELVHLQKCGTTQP